MSWKEQLVKAYMTVPKSLKEGLWKVGLGMMAVTSILTGFYLWRNPYQIFLGVPLERRSPVEVIAGDEGLKEKVYELMEQFFYSNRPYGLMFVSWEEIDSLVGLWVRPADRFPGKAGPHVLTPDMRVLGGPFLFGECAWTESLAIEGKIMVACPVINSYDVWGYVAAVVDNDLIQIEKMSRLLHFLSHRISELIY